MVTATAIKHADVRGKELYYIKLTNGTHDHIINVGKNTYEEVTNLENPEKKEAKLIIEKEKPKIKN